MGKSAMSAAAGLPGRCFRSRRTLVALRLKGDYRIDWPIVKKVFSIGLPAAMEQLVLQGGLTLFARTVLNLGTLQFAAHQIGLNISGLSFSPSMACGVAATTLVGQSLGGGDPEKAQRYAHAVHKMAMGIACLMGAIFLAFSYSLARLYTSDLAAAALAGMVLKIPALAQPGQSPQLTLAGALRGAGDTLYPLHASIVGRWVFRVAAAYAFVQVFRWGLIGAWAAMVLDQYTRAAVIFVFVRGGGNTPGPRRPREAGGGAVSLKKPITEYSPSPPRR